MPIKNFYIDNFSVFKDTKIEFCEGINVIIGENGSGKTQLLKFLYALHESASVENQNHDVQNNGNVQNSKTKVDNGHEKRFEFIQKCFRPYSLDSLLNHSPHFFGITAPKTIGKIVLSLTEDIRYEFLAENKTTTSGAASVTMAHFTSTINNTHSNQSVFIPAKEMLTHSTLFNMNEKYKDQMPYDYTYLKIIELARRWIVAETPNIAKSMKEKIEKIVKGEVLVKEDGSFWMKKYNGFEIPFSNEADGIKKFGLLWQLLMNESITKDTLLFWDEPENSINPKNIPDIVEALLEIQKFGVQVFITTHNYYLARYFDILKRDQNKVKYVNLYIDENNFAKINQAYSYLDLDINSIDDAGERFYNDVVQKAIKETNDE